jgi:hypothetical protein
LSLYQISLYQKLPKRLPSVPNASNFITFWWCEQNPYDEVFDKVKFDLKYSPPYDRIWQFTLSSMIWTRLLLKVIFLWIAEDEGSVRLPQSNIKFLYCFYAKGNGNF